MSSRLARILDVGPQKNPAVSLVHPDTCWRAGCFRSVDPSPDGVGLCPDHIEELREW